MYAYGPNITGSVTVGPTITKTIESLVHISLANASTIVEKAVGANAHTAAVRYKQQSLVLDRTFLLLVLDR